MSRQHQERSEPSREDTDIRALASWADGSPLRRDLLRWDLPELADHAEQISQRTGDRWKALFDACALQGGTEIFDRILSCQDSTTPLPIHRSIPYPDECPVCAATIKHRYRKEDGFFPGITCVRGHYTRGEFAPATQAATPKGAVHVRTRPSAE